MDTIDNQLNSYSEHEQQLPGLETLFPTKDPSLQRRDEAASSLGFITVGMSETL